MAGASSVIVAATMPRFAANLGFLFPEVPLAERFGAARGRGLRRGGIRPALRAGGARDRGAPRGQRPRDGPLQPAHGRHGRRRLRHRLPARARGEFREGVAHAIAYAGVLGNERVNCIAGKAPAGADPAAAARDAPRQPALRRARDARAPASPSLLEPINTVDVPGFFVRPPRRGRGAAGGDGRAQRRPAVRHLPRRHDGRGSASRASRASPR